jgi:hypothetical protein
MHGGNGRGPHAPEHCSRCNGPIIALRNTVWTRERIVEAIQEWASVYGEHPRVCDWDPTKARLLGRKVHLGYTTQPERWPHYNTVRLAFGGPGGWARAVSEAGFTPRSRGALARAAA